MKKLLLLTSLLATNVAFAKDAQPVQFPELNETYLKIGDFVDVRNVRRVAFAQNKDQVRLLLGNPHYSTGIGNTHVWDYAFNFYTGADGGEYITCQYQVQYGRDNRVNGLFWKDGECEALVKGKPAAAVNQTHPVALTSDGLFAFGKSGFNDIQPMGQLRLRELATQIKTGFSNVRGVTIIGYTDRVGSAQKNLNLSRMRAESVKQFLVMQGISANLISTEGRGSANPVVNCPAGQSAKVIACLMPNRRIEVAVNGDK